MPARVEVLKDQHSLYLTVLLNSENEIRFDWSLSRSYTAIVARGMVSLTVPGQKIEPRRSIGLYRVPPSKELKCSVAENARAIIVIPFLLEDDITMNELVPNDHVRNRLLNPNSSLTSWAYNMQNLIRFGPELIYGAPAAGITIFTLADLNQTLSAGFI